VTRLTFDRRGKYQELPFSNLSVPPNRSIRRVQGMKFGIGKQRFLFTFFFISTLSIVFFSGS